MNDDPIALLERELVDAARRHVSHGEAEAPRTAEPARRRALTTIGLLVPIGVAAAVALVALLALGGHTRPSPAHPSAAAASGRAVHNLDTILAVLRRPQTALDRKILSQSGLDRSGGAPFLGGGHVIAASARLATIAPWGSRVLLVVATAPAPGSQQGWTYDARLGRRLGGGLIVWVNHGGGCCSDAAAIESTGSWSSSGAGRSFAGGSTATRFYVVVPDGVARVAFVAPPASIQAGGPTYRHALTVTAPVHGNVAVAELHREFDGGPLMIWYAADGRVIKRVGNFAAAAHAAKPPQPGPATALSRAALRDPATPNPVRATPAVGGPHTTFALRFTQLISDADYAFRFTSVPHGSGCAIGTSTSNPDGGPDDVRGRTFTFRYAAPAEGWCAGTYTFSIALTDRGRAGGLGGRPIAPFGTASFQVRR